LSQITSVNDEVREEKAEKKLPFKKLEKLEKHSGLKKRTKTINRLSNNVGEGVHFFLHRQFLTYLKKQTQWISPFSKNATNLPQQIDLVFWLLHLTPFY